MYIKHVVEKEDGKLIFQGVLEGQELAFVIEMGMDAIIQAGALPFVNMATHEKHDIHDAPEDIQ